MGVKRLKTIKPFVVKFALLGGCKVVPPASVCSATQCQNRQNYDAHHPLAIFMFSGIVCDFVVSTSTVYVGAPFRIIRISQ